MTLNKSVQIQLTSSASTFMFMAALRVFMPGFLTFCIKIPAHSLTILIIHFLKYLNTMLLYLKKPAQLEQLVFTKIHLVYLHVVGKHILWLALKLTLLIA
ncbi:hypothetical protein BAE46_12195 [Glaciecola punicea]|nr:hypothetical protein BAE46_12195 [Glaciecola punicea]